MKKTLFSLYLLLLGGFFFNADAQTDIEDPMERKNFTGFTPNAYAFSKITNIPTSYFTGQIRPSIPLFEKKMSHLKFSMSLDFIAGGGVKVDDPGSAVGRGWMLKTGGIIVRNRMGVPDDYNNVYKDGLSVPPDPEYNGMAYTTGLLETSNGDKINEDAWKYTRGAADNEHDIFEYNFDGHSGKFYIGKNKQILITDGSKLQIIPVFDNNLAGGNLRTFAIIDESGTRYDFEAQEVSITTRLDPTIERGLFDGKAYVSSWLLTKITAPGAMETITFDYYKRRLARSYTIAASFWSKRRTKAYDPTGFYSEEGENSKSDNDTETSSLDIKSITFSDGTKINIDYFLYDIEEPEAVIKYIEIKNEQQDLIKKYAFNYFYYNLLNQYRYINYNQIVPWPKMVYFPERNTMHLESVYMINSVSKVLPVASFTYYMDNTMNEEILFNKNDADYWGYHNGKDNSNNLLLIPYVLYPPANREPNVNFARMGALKRIYYSTGGSEEFEYELNDKWNGTSNETVGGIRLKKRYMHDAIDSRNDIITEYKYSESDGRSSGFLGDKPIFEYLMPHYTSGFPTGTPVWDYVDTVTVSTPVNPLSSVEGSLVGYRRVEEIFKNGNGTNGKMVYEFSNLSFATTWPSDDYYPYSPAQRPTWAVGLPLVTSVYNAAGMVVKRTINEYNITQAFLQSENYRSLYIARRGTIGTAPPINKFRNYYPLTGRSYLLKKRELEYADNDSTQVLENITNIEYNTQYQTIKRISKINSLKDTIVTVYRYPFDYLLGVPGIFTTTMASANVIDKPIAIEMYKKIGSTSYLINAQLDSFINLGNRLFQPSASFKSVLAKPKPRSEAFNPGTLLDTSLNYRPDEYYTNYDSNGRLISFITRKNEIGGAIYDKYNNIIASASNASSAQIAFKSFEPGEGVVGWTYLENNVTNTDSKTGSYSYKGQLTSPVLPSGNYRIRFWAKGSGNVSVNGTNIAVNTQWNFYTINLTGITSVTINSNLSNLDEIAICPIAAKFTTFTNKAEFGMTSDADDNGKLNKYYYDEFNRLAYIKDRDENILKQYEYATKVFRNKILTASYSKYFCSIQGIPGDTVNYTVSPNLYVSLISQADADAKAVMDTLINGQEYARDHAKCIPIYYNDEIYGFFTKQGCPSGYGETMLYKVPEDSVSSLISKADANTKAQAIFNANAQVYVNAHAACRNAVTLSYVNEIATENYHVYLNSTTDQELSYDFTIGYGQGTLGSVIEGAYEVQILAPGGSSNSYNFSGGCGSTSSGTSVFLGNVVIKAGCATISIY